MEDISESLQHVGKALDLARKGVGLWKSLKGTRSTPEQEQQVEQVFLEAEREQQLGLASIGKAFDYTLCRCTVPPQVCTKIGITDYGDERSQCPECAQEYPVPTKGPVVKEPNPGTSWMSR